MNEQWRGVNLGGWLVLEKWMTPSRFAGSSAQDEYSLSSELGNKAAARLGKHRDTFITEADFAWISMHGLNAVRLPVGHWVFGDSKPYVSAIKYVDNAFMWAAKYNLCVILDLHGAPGSQNGRDHSGHQGKIDWGDAVTQQKTLDVLERLASRYTNQPALVGIELMNEPSYALGRQWLTSFYAEAYEHIRRHCDDKVAIIFHDAFRPTRWQKRIVGQSYKNVVIDHHYYQVFGWRDRHRSVRRQLARPHVLAKRIAKLQSKRPAIIGEWSLALPQRSIRAGKANLQKEYAQAQLKAMQSARGWFFWSYKTEAGGAWSYRDCVRHGWLPERFSQQ